ncbi:GspH/FimT family pseudopilin [Pseudomonas lalucatii]|uniref:Type II secretion system protein H n=1 Tax=Pseudomonas lalucatii TaxID=1424203 RepID=A0ABS5Q5U8_9PSED|nr:GspH/FimT family pseudopilin [Pseudomonas lalucatii]MBS7663943.1 GspH/FimT family pseudopilin [Pseudomonas lalucatii]
MNLRTRGYTLHELLSSLAIVSLLLGIAVPEAQRFRANQQLASASNTLATSLALARSESIKRQRPVLIDNGDGDWASGWQVFVDLNNNGQADGGESILRQDAALPSGVIAKGNTPVRRYIRYTPLGNAQLLGGAFQAGTLTICHASGGHAIRRLVLSASGRLRRSQGAAGSC